ncbi:MAG: metallopeptidase family protein [Patescibacteria group bacterium]
MDRKSFEQLVTGGVDAIPGKFLQKMKNVRIVVEDYPSPEQREKLKLRGDTLLLGLYEGVPQPARGWGYTMVLPDKITIFQQSIEQLFSNPADIKKQVKETVWHEIAHHFGLNEKGVQEATKRQRPEAEKKL